MNGRRPDRDRGHQADDDDDHALGVEMFRKLLDQGQAGDNIGCAASRREARGHRARPGSGQAPEERHAAHEVQGRGLHPQEGGGRPSQAVLRRLPPAVLLPHDRRDRFDITLPEGVEMVMPGDNVTMQVELITADRDGEAASLRHSRGWPHRRRRRRRQGHRVTRYSPFPRGTDMAVWQQDSHPPQAPTTTSCWTSPLARSSRPRSARASTSAARSRCRPPSTGGPCCVDRTSTRSPASSSSVGPTTGSSTFSSPPSRPSMRS